MKTYLHARLAKADSAILQEVKAATGETDSEIVRRGLRLVAQEARGRRSALDLRPQRRPVHERSSRPLDEPGAPRRIWRVNPRRRAARCRSTRGLAVQAGRQSRRARAMFAACVPPFRCCEAVVAEACFLMRKVHIEGPAEVVALGAQGVYEVAMAANGHWSSIEALLKKYADQPISFADACLIRCAEIHEEARIATFDSDFGRYRWARNASSNRSDRDPTGLNSPQIGRQPRRRGGRPAAAAA